MPLRRHLGTCLSSAALLSLLVMVPWGVHADDSPLGDEATLVADPADAAEATTPTAETLVDPDPTVKQVVPWDGLLIGPDGLIIEGGLFVQTWDENGQPIWFLDAGGNRFVVQGGDLAELFRAAALPAMLQLPTDAGQNLDSPPPTGVQSTDTPDLVAAAPADIGPTVIAPTSTTVVFASSSSTGAISQIPASPSARPSAQAAVATPTRTAVPTASPTPVPTRTPTPTPLVPAPAAVPPPSKVVGEFDMPYEADGLTPIAPAALLAGISHTLVYQYYAVTGPLESIAPQLRAPVGAGWGVTESRYELRTTNSTASSGGCAVTNIAINLRTVITLPRWDNPNASADDHARWDQTIRVLTRHELGHRAIDLHGANALRTAVGAIPAASTCVDLGTAVQRTSADIYERVHIQDALYDLRTRHGVLQGLSL